MTAHQDAAFVFPFGQPVLPYQRPDRTPRHVFVLGAYPSALHVWWQPPAPYRRIQAVAVDNEPSPFWDGRDQDERVKKWQEAVQFKESWGQIRSAGDRNGSSGRPVSAQVLVPLHIDANDVWLTDCIDTYRCSVDLARRIEDTYRPAIVTLGLPATYLPPHPSENKIVTDAQHERLRNELAAAQPALIVTLGNAALRVVRRLSVDPAGLPQSLRLDQASYGLLSNIAIAPIGRVSLLPLAHPAAPPQYKAQHQHWIHDTAERVARTLNTR